VRTICPSEIEPRIDAASVTAQPSHLPHAYFLINGVHDEDHGHDGDLRRDVRTTAQELAPCRLSRACKRVAATVTLIQSARLNGHEPFAYLNDLLNVSVLSTPS
jgi:hypothetical protein